MSKRKRNKRDYDDDVIRLSDYPPWLRIIVVSVIATIFIIAFVPDWALYTVIVTAVVSFVVVSYWLYKKKGINFPKELAKTGYEGYKKLDEEWKKDLVEKEPAKGENRKIVPPLSQSEISRIKVKYGHKCMWPRCNEEVALDVHHIIPRSESGSNKEKNLIVLCPTHHRMANAIPKKEVYLMKKQWMSN